MGIYQTYSKILEPLRRWGFSKVPFFKYLHKVLSPWLKSRTIVIRGMKFHLNPKDEVITNIILKDGEWEPFITDLFEQTVQEGWKVVDVGANIGHYSVLSSRLVGASGKVYAFEPDPDNYEFLQKNLEENRCLNVESVRKAVSSAPGRITLHLSPENKGDHRIYAVDGNRREVEIEAVTLDDYFGDLGQEIDFIKMDIQGAEALALEGARKILDNPHLQMILEFSRDNIRKSGRSAKNCLRLLEDKGFTLSYIDESAKKLIPISTTELLAIGDANVFCTKRS